MSMALGLNGRHAEDTVVGVRMPVRVRRNVESGEFTAECVLLGIVGKGPSRFEALESMRTQIRDKVRQSSR